MNLKDQSTSSFEIDKVDNNFEESTNTFRYEIDEVDNNLEESTNTFRSTEAIELFFGKSSFIQCFTIDYVFTNINILDKRPQVANWTNFDLHACLKPTEKFKIKDAKWNVNEYKPDPSLYSCMNNNIWYKVTLRVGIRNRPPYFFTFLIKTLQIF